MTRYEECRNRLQTYVDHLRATPLLNSSAIENLVRSHVERPGYDVTFRDQLVRDALAPDQRRPKGSLINRHGE